MAKQTDRDKLVLVTGATGQQGGAALRHLRERGFRVRAFARDAAKARRQLGTGVEVSQGDYDDKASLARALDEIWGVFSVQNPMDSGVEGEVRQGNAIADAAQRAGISHFVYTSTIGADLNTGIPFFETKNRIEEHIRQIGIPHTILRPVWFMENWLGMGDSIRGGAIRLPLDPGTVQQQIAVDDIGRIAAEVFEHPGRYRDRAIEIASDETSMRDVAATFSRVLSREVQYQQIPWEDFERAAGPDFARMYRFLEEGFQTGRGRVDMSGVRTQFPRLTRFDAWAQRQNWEQFSEAARRPAAS
ncbi:MAG TPA: NmrA/HSCARG family protein [Bryobacteraceae bacterium]|nr:NmrA/HSCARG family protein [Bryobacteraceae bacterium]